jgi:hypothetical protein
MTSKIGPLFVIALFALTTAANAQGTGGAAPTARSNSVTTGASMVPSDQKPTNTQNALPECGMAAETDTAGTNKTPCTPKNVAPKVAR